MAYQISAQRVPHHALAVIRAEIPYAEIAARLRPLYDRIHGKVHRSEITPSGHNVILYRDGPPGTWATEVGIQVAEPFSDLGEVVCSQTPEGLVAACTYQGPYRGLGSAPEAIIQWV